MNKFEQLVEYIINEDEEQASQLFHEIVVEKSREIYNDLVNEDFDEEVDEADETDDFIDDIESDEEGDSMDMDDNDMDMDDDDMDDNDMDMDDDDMDMDDEEIEDRVVDLESAIDELKAEFDAMMADDDGDGDIDGHEHDEADEDEEVDEEFAFEAEDDEDEDDDEDDMDESIVREYTEKVAEPKGEDHKAKSTVAGKNDMGGTAQNINTGGDAKGRPAPKAKDMSTGNRNVPGGKANSLEKAPAAVKKAEKGTDGSPLNGAPKRAK